MVWRQQMVGTTYGEFLKSIKSMLVCPLVDEGKTIGVMMAFGDKTGEFSEEDRAIFQKIANYAEGPIRNAILNESALLLQKMAESFHGLLRSMADEDSILEKALKYAVELTECRAGHISILDPNGKWLIQKLAFGAHLGDLPQYQAPTKGINGRAMRLRQIQLVSYPYHQDPDFQEYVQDLDDEQASLLKDLPELLVVPLLV